MATFNFNSSGQFTNDFNAQWSSGIQNVDHGRSISLIHDVGEISSDMNNQYSPDLQTLERTIDYQSRAKYAWNLQENPDVWATKSLQLNGSSQYGEVTGDPAELKITSDLTVSVWVKIPATTNNVVKVINKDSGSNPTRAYAIGVREGTGTGSWFLVTWEADGTQHIAEGTDRITDGNWHHICAVHDAGGQMRTYTDGVLDDDSSAGSDIRDISDNLLIGRKGDGTQYFEDYITELAIFDSAFDQTAVTEAYNGGAPMNMEDHSEAANLQGYWRPDESSGSTLTDVSSSENDATLYNSPTFSNDIPGGGLIQMLNNGNDTSLVLSLPSSFSFQQSPVETIDYDTGESYIDTNANGSIKILPNETQNVITNFSFGAFFRVANAQSCGLVSKTNGSTQGWGFRTFSNNKWPFYFFGAGGLSKEWDVQASMGLSDGDWHLVGFSFESDGTLTLYADGSEIPAGNIVKNSDDSFTQIALSTANLYLARYYTTTGNKDIAQAALIGKALSASEWSEWNSIGRTGDLTGVSFSANLISYWPCREIDPDRVIDFVGINDGELLSPAAYITSVVEKTISDAYSVSGDDSNYGTIQWSSDFRDSFTWEIRIKPSADDIIGIHSILEASQGSGTHMILFRLNGGTIQYYTSVNGSNFLGPINSDSPLVAGEWYHIRIGYGPNNDMYLSVNGQQQGSKVSYGGTLYDHNTALEVFGGTEYSEMSGEFSDIVFYNEERPSYYKVPETIYSYQPIAKHAYTCQETSGIILNDIGSNHANGIISGTHNLGVSGPWGTSTAIRADGTSLSEIPWDASMRNNFTWKFNYKPHANDVSGGVKYVWGAFDIAGAKRCITLRVSSTNTQMLIGQGGTSAASTDADPLVAGTWYEIAISYDGTTGRLFVDGRLVGTASSITGDLTDYSATIKIGGIDDPHSHSEGDFANFRFETAAITSDYVVKRGLYEAPDITFQHGQSDDEADENLTWNGEWLTDLEDETNGNKRYLYLKTRIDDEHVTLTNVSIDNFIADLIPPSGLNLTETSNISTFKEGVLVDWDEPSKQTQPDYDYTVVEAQLNGGSWYIYSDYACMSPTGNYMKFKGYLNGSGVEEIGTRNKSYVALLDCDPIVAGANIRARAKSFDTVGNASAWDYGPTIVIGTQVDYPEVQHVLNIDTVNFQSGEYVPANSGVVVKNNLYGEYGTARSGVFVCTPPIAPSGAELDPPPSPPIITGVS